MRDFEKRKRQASRLDSFCCQIATWTNWLDATPVHSSADLQFPQFIIMHAVLSVHPQMPLNAQGEALNDTKDK